MSWDTIVTICKHYDIKIVNTDNFEPKYSKHDIKLYHDSIMHGFLNYYFYKKDKTLSLSLLYIKKENNRLPHSLIMEIINYVVHRYSIHTIQLTCEEHNDLFCSMCILHTYGFVPIHIESILHHLAQKNPEYKPSCVKCDCKLEKKYNRKSMYTLVSKECIHDGKVKSIK